MTYRDRTRAELVEYYEGQLAEHRAEIAMLRDAAKPQPTPWPVRFVRLFACGLAGGYVAEHRPSMALGLIIGAAVVFLCRGAYLLATGWRS